MYYVPDPGISSISAGLMQNALYDDSHFSAEAPIDRSPATTQRRRRVKYLKKTNVQGRSGAVSTFFFFFSSKMRRKGQ